MFNFFSAIAFIILATLFMQACSKNNDTPPVGGGNNTDTVTIQATQFLPATLTVLIGTKVTWKNPDVNAHTVTSDDGISFSSGNISPNGLYSFTFTSPGSYLYHCTLHAGMTGTIQVVSR